MSGEGSGRSGEEPQPDRKGRAEPGARKADDEHAASPGSDPGADRSPPRPAAGYVCDICGSAMLERHCKILCPVCGYQRDCSDP